MAKFRVEGGWVEKEFYYESTKVKGKFRPVIVVNVESGNKLRFYPIIEFGGNGFEKAVTAQYKLKARTGDNVLTGETDLEISLDQDDDVNEAAESVNQAGAEKWTKWHNKKTKIKSQGDHPLRSKPLAIQDLTLSLRVRIKYTYTIKHERKKGKKKETYYTYHTKKTITSTVTANFTQQPQAPELVSYAKNSWASDGSLWLEAIYPATEERPIKGTWLEKQNDLSQSSWDSTGRSYDFSIGNSDGICRNGTLWRVTDERLSPGTKWRYRVGVWNTGSGGRQENWGAYTDWIYGEPPAVDEFTAQRHGTQDNIAILHLRRSSLSCNRALIRGFIIEYNDDPKDLGMGTKWKTLIKVTDQRGYTIAPYDITGNSEAIKKPGDMNSNAQFIRWTDATVEQFDFWHVGLSGDAGYRYRIRTINATSEKNGPTYSTRWQYGRTYSPGATGTDTVYTSPNPPLSVTPVLNTDMTRTLTIKKVNNTTTADTMYIERKIDDGDWVNITDSGVPLAETYLDSEILMGRSVIYRVAFGNTKGFETPELNYGKSGWRESGQVLIIKAPNPPTLLTPINRTKASIESSYHRLSWTHNPADLNDQTAYKIEIGINDVSGGAQKYIITGTGAINYYDLTLDKLNEIALEIGEALSEKDVIYWRVRTQATEEMGYGDWSSYFSFTLLGKPKIEIIRPADLVVSLLPLELEWSYIDNSGDPDPVDLTISIEQQQKVLKTYKLEDCTVRSFSITDFLFDNEEEYTVAITVVSSSTYSNSTSLNFTIRYIPIEIKNGMSLMYAFNERHGYTRLTLLAPLPDDYVVDPPEVIKSDDIVEEAIPGEEIDAVPESLVEEEEELEPIIIDSPLSTLYLYRNYEGERELVASYTSAELGVTTSNEVTILDYYAPINRPFKYELLQLAENGAVSLMTYDVHFGASHPILWWYAIWEKEGVTFSVRSRWNPSVNIALNRPEKQQVRYSGRKYPVIYDGNARSETASYTMTLFEDEQVEDDGWETLRLYRKLMHDGAHGVWKSFEGDVYTADFDFNYSANYTNKIRSWNCTLNVTRTEREE